MNRTRTFSEAEGDGDASISGNSGVSVRTCDELSLRKITITERKPATRKTSEIHPQDRSTTGKLNRWTRCGNNRKQATKGSKTVKIIENRDGTSIITHRSSLSLRVRPDEGACWSRLNARFGSQTDGSISMQMAVNVGSSRGQR